MGLFSYPKRRLKKLIKEGEYVEALEFGKSMESKFTDDHDYMFIMGSVYYILEDPEKALPYFEKAYELDTADVENLTLKTNVHLALEQKEQAIDCCKKIIQLDSKNSEAHDLLEELESI